MAMSRNGRTTIFEERRERALSINLPQILQHVGPGQYQSIGLVSKAWHEVVHTVPSVNCTNRLRQGIATYTVLSRMTTYDAVFESTSRFRWAYDTGFRLGAQCAIYAAGLYASTDTLLRWQTN
jgi:hypothetical protein